MTRYVSPYKNLVLLTKTQGITPPSSDPNPVAAYNFYYGELIVGDPTVTTGSGNLIDYTKLQVVFPTASGNAQYGLNQIFWELPYLTSAATLTVGKKYKVQLGPVTYGGVLQKEEVIFTCVSGTTSFTGSGIVTQELDAQYKRIDELDLRAQAYIENNLDSNADQASWNNATWKAESPTNPMTWVRS